MNPQSAGGKARAKVLTPEQRREIASRAAKARWSRPRKCITMACPNYNDAGTFIGNLCAPCHAVITGWPRQSQSAVEIFLKRFGGCRVLEEAQKKC